MPISTSDHSSLTLLPYITKKNDPPIQERVLYQKNVKLSIKDLRKWLKMMIFQKVWVFGFYRAQSVVCLMQAYSINRRR